MDGRRFCVVVYEVRAAMHSELLLLLSLLFFVRSSAVVLMCCLQDPHPRLLCTTRSQSTPARRHACDPRVKVRQRVERERAQQQQQRQEAAREKQVRESYEGKLNKT